MSIARIGTRAAVVGLGVLASLAFTTAPSWAAKGGNSANAALCEEGGYPGALLGGNGSAFKNAGQCTKAGAHGELAGVNAVAGPAVGGAFHEACSGFGLEPGSSAACGAHYAENGPREDNSGEETPVQANGTWGLAVGLPCHITFFGGTVSVTFLFVEATTANGTSFKRTFPPPSGC
jgi:hypothetical protein